jgi:hypothetical protein
MRMAPSPSSSTFMVMSTRVIPRRVSCRGLGVGGVLGFYRRLAAEFLRITLYKSLLTK